MSSAHPSKFRYRLRIRRTRRGASAVEFALVAPLLFLGIVMPMIEFGRAMMAAELACNAARAGCRAGVIPGASNSTITSAVDTLLTGERIGGASTTIRVKGSSANASTAMQGDTIAVTVSIPYNSISWLLLNASVYMKGKSISSTQTMRRE